MKKKPTSRIEENEIKLTFKENGINTKNSPS